MKITTTTLNDKIIYQIIGTAEEVESQIGRIKRAYSTAEFDDIARMKTGEFGVNGARDASEPSRLNQASEILGDIITRADKFNASTLTVYAKPSPPPTRTGWYYARQHGYEEIEPACYYREFDAVVIAGHETQFSPLDFDWFGAVVNVEEDRKDKELVASLRAELQDAKLDGNAEQGKFDNMSEGLQQSGQSIASSLDSACESLAISSLEESSE